MNAEIGHWRFINITSFFFNRSPSRDGKRGALVQPGPLASRARTQRDGLHLGEV